jgi:hypothetical protein
MTLDEAKVEAGPLLARAAEQAGRLIALGASLR